MIGYHVTTTNKLERYKSTGVILPPVRFWPNEYTAKKWAKKTLRDVVLKIKYGNSFPLPDHKPARWTPEIIRYFKLITIENKKGEIKWKR